MLARPAHRDERSIARITLDRPARHNALVPELVAKLNRDIAAAASASPRALVLTGAGRSFSTGGDIRGFLDHAGDADALRAYAHDLVGALNEAILALLRFPAPVIARVNGPVTGGSVGLVLAADLVAMSETAFIQPYYAEVGFCPDGGWTALMPERAGTAKALDAQYLNRRILPAEAVSLGLATQVAAPDALDAVVDGWCAEMAQKSFATLAVARARIWDEERIAAVARRLAAERHHFVELVAQPDTIARMRSFVGDTQ